MSTDVLTAPSDPFREPDSCLMGAREEVVDILGAHGLLVVRDHPNLRRTAERMCAEGTLQSLLPGVLCHRQDALIPEILLRAAAAWSVDGVLTGRAAARLTYWPRTLTANGDALSSARPPVPAQVHRDPGDDPA